MSCPATGTSTTTPRSSTATSPTPTPRASTSRRRTSTITGTRTTDRARRAAGLLVLTTLALAACGGGSGPPGPPGPAGPTATATTAGATTTAPAATTTTAAAAKAWSTSSKHGPGDHELADGPSAKLAAARAARHPGYDRVVFQFEGDEVPAYRVGYVRRVFLGESDQVVTLEGDAFLEATFNGKASDDYRPGTQTIPDRLTPALPQVRQLALAEDFEGVIRIGIGLDHRAGFRVLELTGPVRVVVDVAT
jgi:hypothetical protein